MTSSKSVFTIFIAMLFLSLIGCGSTSTRESTGEYLDDATITTKVKAAIFNEVTLKSSEINVETYKGVVQLSGFVSSQVNIDTAMHVTQKIKGVKSVHNAMKVK
ncbi:MAG: BON domain-containing protein [Pseudomonadota bacterium]|nr:BON domain-containing protein [Pseudomonadota bacterium]MDO7710491.1 BON domain-containing protein [Pseudomonadota bacterium]